MVYTYPDYYNKFKCSADACSDTCCSGWKIVIDDETLENYRNGVSDNINMHRYVDFNEGVFKRWEDGRCSLLLENNLCLLCMECGEEALCRTCHLYPRHIEEFENVREITLSLSCPEVARILMTKEDKARFTSVFSNKPLHGDEEAFDVNDLADDEAAGDDDIEADEFENYANFDYPLYSMLCEARDICINILQNRTIPIDVRAGMVLGLTHDIQKRLNNGTFFTTGDLLKYVVTDDALKKSAEKVNTFLSDKNKVYEFMHEKFEKLFTLEPIGFSWIDLYTESEYTLYRKGVEHYIRWSEKFDVYMAEKEMNFDIRIEQLLVYFVFTYLCGAVYDSTVYGKGKLCVYSMYYVRELLKAAFIKNGGELTEEEIIDIVVRYSRELEHSDENLMRMERF